MCVCVSCGVAEYARRNQFVERAALGTGTELQSMGGRRSLCVWAAVRARCVLLQSMLREISLPRAALELQSMGGRIPFCFALLHPPPVYLSVYPHLLSTTKAKGQVNSNK